MVRKADAVFLRKFLFFILLGTISFEQYVQAEAGTSSPRLLVHLLEYLAVDYGGAVEKGKIVSQSEYDEQIEFAASALKIIKDLSTDSKYSELIPSVEKLGGLIKDKKNAADVTKLSREIKQNVISLSHLEMAPTAWPDTKQGAELFKAQCVSCHGPEGKADGPAAKGLDPAPRNFHDQDYMNEMTGFHAYNVIRLGIPGTGMLAHPQLSDREVWDLAFYILSLRHKPATWDEIDEVSNTSLEEMATLSDTALRQKFSKYPDEKKNQAIAFLRTRSFDGNEDHALRLSRDRLVEAEKQYELGNNHEARSLALSSYLDGFEPVEPKLRSMDSNFVLEIERDFAEVRQAIEEKKSFAEVKEKVTRAQVQIARAESLLRKQDDSFGTVFWLAAGIIFREGFEAVLIILAMLGVIRAANARRARRYVHGGWAVAIGLGLLAWFFTGWMVIVSGAKREFTEAFASLFAVIILVYVGLWLHSKTEVKRWTQFIDGQVRDALEGERRWGLFALSFIAVFREALESVLFLRALVIEGAGDSSLAMGLGVICSFVLIIALAWGLLKFSMTLPVRQMFSISSWLMIALSIMLMGKGIRALQEVGVVPMSFVKLPFELSFLGIFPTTETLVAQGLLLAGSIALWKYLGKPRRR